jgi:hypothetical protein
MAALQNTYFKSQRAALEEAYSGVNSKLYDIKFPDNIWTEHVNYEQYVRYTLQLIVKKTGNLARKCLHITLYRMPSGRYELTNYVM